MRGPRSLSGQLMLWITATITLVWLVAVGFGALVMRDEFRVEDNEGKLLARRVQIPLVLAWAMSIHKSQGQTIEYVKIDLGSVFEKGELDFALCSLGVSGD